MDVNPITMKIVEIAISGPRNSFALFGLFPPTSRSLLNPICDITAPSFPDAALMPYAVARNLVGNNSADIIKVMLLGPEFWKN